MTVNTQKRRRYRIRRVSRPAPQREISPAKRIYLLLTAISASGVLIGALSGVYHGNAVISIPAGFADAFIGSFAAVMLYTLLLFLGGTSPAGAFCGYFLCLFKGMGAGFLSAAVFRNGAFSADLREVINVLPFEAVSMAAVIFALALTACTAVQVNERIFVALMGIEEDDGLYYLTVQAFNSTEVSQDEPIPEYAVYSGTGRSFNEAADMIMRDSGRELFWGHCGVIFADIRRLSRYIF